MIRRHPSVLAVVVTATVTLLVAGCSSDGDPEAEDTSSDTAATPAAPTEATTDGDTATAATTAAATPAATASSSASPDPAATVPADLPALQGLALEQIASGLTQPVDVVVRPDDASLWVVQQGGTVVGIEEDGSVSSTPLLDVSPEMEIHSIEQGLLGMAFHPDYPEDARIFAFHSLPSNDNVLASWEVDQATQQADPSSRIDLFTVDKEPDKVRHNGGKVLFGPDGLLYVSLGDAARASVNGQDPSTLPGTLVRIDIDTPGDGGAPYSIPPGNPFADGATIDGVEGAPEVWWFGLRNPWRFSIDASTGLVWIGDVGQESWEEVNVAPLDQPGLNFGWAAREGDVAFYDDPPVTDAVDPIAVVAHDDVEQGCSITGGAVHRGAAIPELDGTYFYADWCNGWIRSLEWDGQAIVAEDDWSEDLAVTMVS
ncbi:MAG TPA: PQQ-dependent sugar dehydrogenase, partial [Nitriliruptoraceae bacterium]|nr:PQQ-dependent sugar dehydrogenase [Nitriliruptoraceae bacterium]